MLLPVTPVYVGRYPLVNVKPPVTAKTLDTNVRPVCAVALLDVPFAVKIALLVVCEIAENPAPVAPEVPVVPGGPVAPVGPV
jgi:hypothetical protein